MNHSPPNFSNKERRLIYFSPSGPEKASNGGRILITAVNNEFGTVDEGKVVLERTSKEAVFREMNPILTDDHTVLSLNILAKDAEHGYLGDISAEEFRNKTPDQQASETLGAEGENADT